MKAQREKNVHAYLTEALFDLMEKKQYEDITITEITLRAGVGRVSFYRNFQSKEDIIKKWISKTTDTFLQNSDISYAKDSTEDYFVKLFTHLRKYQQQAILIHRANLSYLLKEEFDQKILHIYKEKYQNYKSYFIAGGIYNVYVYWLKHGCKETPEALAKELVHLLQK